MRVLTVVAFAASAALAACGAPPPYQYVANADRSLVVRVPASWTTVEEAEPTPGQWTAFVDASSAPSPKHFAQEDAGTAPTDPVLQLATVGTTPEQLAGLSDEDVLDLIWPATQRGAERRRIQGAIDVDPAVQYVIGTPVEMRSGAAKGLKVESLYDFGAGPVHVNKMVFVDPAGKHLHAIQIWCSLTCYEARRSEIDAVMASFTVKQP